MVVVVVFNRFVLVVAAVVAMPAVTLEYHCAANKDNDSGGVILKTIPKSRQIEVKPIIMQQQ